MLFLLSDIINLNEIDQLRSINSVIIRFRSLFLLQFINLSKKSAPNFVRPLFLLGRAFALSASKRHTSISSLLDSCACRIVGAVTPPVLVSFWHYLQYWYCHCLSVCYTLAASGGSPHPPATREYFFAFASFFSLWLRPHSAFGDLAAWLHCWWYCC